jgi:hypothetical protein
VLEQEIDAVAVGHLGRHILAEKGRGQRVAVGQALAHLDKLDHVGRRGRAEDIAVGVPDLHGGGSGVKVKVVPSQGEPWLAGQVVEHDLGRRCLAGLVDEPGGDAGHLAGEIDLRPGVGQDPQWPLGVEHDARLGQQLIGFVQDALDSSLFQYSNPRTDHNPLQAWRLTADD